MKLQIKNRKTINNILLALVIVIFLFSAYKLINIYVEYHRGTKEYDKIVKAVIENSIPQNIAEEVIENSNGKEQTHNSLKVDFEKLIEVNPDVVAWIQFDTPEEINYPVVQGPDNAKYLRTTIEGKSNTAGTIFMDANNQKDFSDKNTFIYGHDMKNGSMFGKLSEYKDKEFYDQNPYFYIYTPDGNEIQYKIFAICTVEDFSSSYTYYYEDDEQYLSYLNHIRGIADYDTGVAPTADSQIVSLSTCVRGASRQRLLIHGVKISETMGEE